MNATIKGPIETPCSAMYNSKSSFTLAAVALTDGKGQSQDVPGIPTQLGTSRTWDFALTDQRGQS